MAGSQNLAVPFRFVNGRAVTVDRDTEQEIQQCVAASMRTVRGTRLERTEYGRPDMAFRLGGPTIVPLREAIARDEPRATYSISTDLSDMDAMIGRVAVQIAQTDKAGR